MFTAFFNSQTDRLINESLFDRRKLRMQDLALHTKDVGVSNSLYFENQKVVVSLTTFSKRLYEVYVTIESIMQQTVKPNLIILWLADGMRSIELPQILKNQQNRGLEIRFCKDLKSYKKLIPTLKTYPNDIIITVDDDVIYEFDMIENLIRSYKQAPEYVYANRVRRMAIEDGKIRTYSSWKLLDKPMEDSPLNIPTGVGGVLYPPHCFTDEVFNENVFMDMCGRADDIWFKSMCLLNGTQSRLAMTHAPVYYENANVQDIALYNSNVNDNQNDTQLKAVFDHYKLYSKL